jgi:chitosanase
LGQYIYYDALVVHGPGDDEDSFNGIRVAAQKLSDTPAQGGSEKDYLLSFLEARTKIMEKEEAHTDLSRIRTQQKFIEESNYTLDLPLEWVMYEEDFKLTQEELEKMK